MFMTFRGAPLYQHYFVDQGKNTKVKPGSLFIYLSLAQTDPKSQIHSNCRVVVSASVNMLLQTKNHSNTVSSKPESTNNKGVQEIAMKLDFHMNPRIHHFSAVAISGLVLSSLIVLINPERALAEPDI